jgi:Membrane-associated phospholipid phosphatase
MAAPAPKTSSRWSKWHEKFVVEVRYLDPSARRRFYLLAAVLVIVGASAFSILLVSVLTHSGIEQLDLPLERWINLQRSSSMTGFMIALAIIFGPVALPIIIFVVVVTWIIRARHVWRPLLLAGGMLVGVITALVLAPLVKHPRPPITLMLFGPDHSFSFPSGHVLGTSDFFLLLAFLLASRIQRTWFTVTAVTVAVVMVTVQVISRLYLGYHWLTDTAASVSLSMVIVGVVIAIDTRRTVRVPGEKVTGELSRPQTEGT